MQWKSACLRGSAFRWFCVVLSISALVMLQGQGCGGGLPDDGETDDGNSQDGTDDGSSSDDGGGTDDGSGGPGSSDTVISDQTQILKDDLTIDVGDDGSMEISGNNLPLLYPGNVIVSAENGGLLARVVSVTEAGGSLVLQTEPASLTDVIEQGRLQINDKLDMSNARLILPEYGKQARLYKTNTHVLSSSEFSIELGDKATVKISDVSFSLNPDFDFDLQINDFKIQRFRCVAEGQAEASLTAEVEVSAVTGLLEKEVELLSLSWPQPAGIVMIGTVPVVWEFFMEVSLGAGVYAGDLGKFEAELGTSTSITAGAEYNRGDANWGWTPIAEFSFDPTGDLGDVSLTPLRAEVYIKPKFGIRFYKVIGPSISYKEYLEVVGNSKFGEIGAELRNGREIDLNFVFEIIDPIKFQYSKNLYENSDVLMARVAYGTNPADLGQIYYAPPGMAGLYWHTVDLSVSASAEPGYEVAGYSVQNLLNAKHRIINAEVLEAEPVDASKLITAHFVPEGAGDDWSGSGVSGAEGSCTITAEVFPPGAGSIVLFPTMELYRSGDEPMAQAKPGPGFVFHHWEGRASGEDPVTTFKINGDCTVKAVFASDPPRTLRVPGDYATLQDAIDMATYNDIIELGAGTFTGDGNRDLDFEDPWLGARYADSVTIRGQGCGVTIIDLQGNASSPHYLARFGDTEGTATFRNMTIRNSYTTSTHGAIHVYDKTTAPGDGFTSLVIDGVCFEECQASGNSVTAAVYFGDPEEGQSLTIADSTFTGCVGGEAVRFDSSYAEMDVTISNCTFTGNAGCIRSPGFDGNITISNSAFSYNTTESAIDFDGVEAASITGCAFTENTANVNGAAINSERSIINVSQCMFANNGVTGQGYAGAVYTRDGASFETCSFTGNYAHIAGAAYVGSGGVLKNCTIDGNESNNNGGGLYLGGSAFDCTFTHNVSRGDGGGVYLYGGTLEGSVIMNNTAGLWGGGISSGYAGGMVSSCEINNNAAGGGGGIRMQRGVIRNCEVSNNLATEQYGGGIRANDSEVYACAVRSNQASNSNGGGGTFDGCVISGCTFRGNTAMEEGGGLSARDCTVSDCVINENVAGEGGGVHCWGDDTRLHGISQTDNTPNNCSGCTDCP